MAKPTLFQSILGRPSQTYHFPATREYHSNRQDLVRVATETPTADTAPNAVPVLGPLSESYQNPSASPATHSRASSPRPRPQREAQPAARPSRKNSTTSRHSKNRPLSQSIASSHSNTDPQTERTVITSSSSTPPTSLSGDTTPRFTPLSSLHRNSSSLEGGSGKQTPLTIGHEGDNEASLGEEESTDSDDVFYTPRSSLYNSPRTSRGSTNMLIDPKALTYALLPLPSSPLLSPKSSLTSKPSVDGLSPHALDADDPISRTSSESSFTSSASSSSTEETVSTHITSTSRATTTTRITTAQTSDYGVVGRANDVETITIASSRSSPDPKPTVRGQPRPLAATRQRRRSQTEIRRQTYTDDDWAKDVRWLAPVDPSKPDSPRRHSRKLSSDLTASKDAPLSSSTLPSTKQPVHYYVPNSYPPPARSAEHRKRESARRSRGSRSSRGRMSALLEEDESEYSDITPTSSSTEPSRAPSPVPEEQSDTQPPPSSLLGVTRSASHRSAREGSSDDAAESPDARLQAYARSNGQRKRSYSHTRRLSRSISPTAFPYSQTLPTYSIPNPVSAAVASSSTNGHTTLTLPRAGYTSNGKAGSGDGKVDLVRAGIAQSSMATVEVTRGVARVGASSDSRRKRRMLSFSFSFKFLDVKGLGRAKGKGKEGQTPAHLLDSLPLPVEFTSHMPPPTYIPSQHVLLQVFAVGLDGLDSLLVYEKASSNGKGAGFIPGRSVIGKVIETGWEVKEDVCRKGDWVVGLLDVRKSGALAEFIVVERHRVYRAPPPVSRPPTLIGPPRRGHTRSLSLPSNINSMRHPYSQIHRELLASTSLSIEELALLPLCALPAHRAIRTFADIISSAKPDADSSRAHKPRIFVLQGHDGPGAMTVQMLARRGVRVCVQVPDSAARDDHNEGDDEDESPGVAIHRNSGVTNGKAKETRFDRLDARLRSWGAEEVCVGEPLEVLERFVEEGRSFDAVLDTVGGVEIWEQSRRVLLADPESDPTRRSPPLTLPTASPSTLSSHSSRPSSSSNKRSFAVTQFTTLVGDTPSRPIPTAHDNFRSGIRSLTRTASSSGTRSRSRSPSGPGPGSSSSVLSSPSKDSISSLIRRKTTNGRVKMQKRTVSYAWICAAADVDFEGEDIRDSLGAVVSMVEEGWIRPWLGDDAEGTKVVAFDKAPEVFRRHGDSPVGLLKDGGTCVVKVAG